MGVLEDLKNRFNWFKNNHNHNNENSKAVSYNDLDDKPAASADEKVKASSTDPAAGYLDAKVDDLTIEVSGNELRIKPTTKIAVKMSANGTVLNSTRYLIPFNTKSVDALNEWDATNYRFDPSENGRYAFNILFSFAANGTGYRAIEIWINGVSSNRQIYMPALSVANPVYNLSTEIDLLSTDYVEIKGRQGSGVSLTTFLLWNFLEISRVKD